MILRAGHHACMTSFADTITIRRATEADATALDRLARLDSQRLTAGPHLIASAGDRPVAAASLADGRLIADPFVASQPVADLLRERVAALTGDDRRRPGVPAFAVLRGLLPAAPRRA
jgi:hypothetical protein